MLSFENFFKFWFLDFLTFARKQEKLGQINNKINIRCIFKIWLLTKDYLTQWTLNSSEGKEENRREERLLKIIKNDLKKKTILPRCIIVFIRSGSKLCSTSEKKSLISSRSNLEILPGVP